MTITDQELAERLRKGPSVLFLGQKYLQLESGTDLFLSSTLAKFGVSNDQVSYDALLTIDADNVLDWMHGLALRLSPPTWLETVVSFAWSHIFSSAIDTIWWRSLRTEWRETYPIYNDAIFPEDSRSKSVLHATFLYGSVAQADNQSRAPISRREYRSRKVIATSLLRRVPEIVSPFGTLIIEGYSPENDWLPIDDLTPILDALGPHQIHLFHAGESLLEYEDISYLVECNKLTLHAESLGEFLVQQETLGYINLGPANWLSDQTRQVTIAKNAYEIPLYLWNQTRKSCTVLTDLILLPPPRLSEDKTYWDYKAFLAESSIKPVWSAYARDYPFERDFEPILRSKVQNQLASSTLHDQPIILFGPSGTGKTVALGKLAYDIYKDMGRPVLFIERKSQRPNYSDLDAYCKWAEDNGSESVLIIWDGMLESHQYYELLRYLTGRGRKVVLVGSSYHETTYGTFSDNESYVFAPPDLHNEMDRLKEYLSKYDPALGVLLDKYQDTSFLVALYRLLPSSRSSLRSGLLTEVAHAEAQMVQRGRSIDYSPVGSLGVALVKSGLFQLEKYLLTEDITDNEHITVPQKLIGLVMVPGRFGLRVPLELLIRAADLQWIDSIEQILDDNLFVIIEDDHGNISVAPRHPLEAEIICQSKFSTARSEFSFAEMLIEKMSPSYSNEGLEVQFVVDLVRRMGPNGQNAPYFASSFLDISQALTNLRLKRSIQIPRLMLQEATLVREYVMYKGRNESVSPEHIDLLNRAEETLQKALQLLESEGKKSRLQTFILVELGAILATRAKILVEQSENITDVLRIYHQSRTTLLAARFRSPEDYHPVDTMLWLAESLLLSSKLSDLQRTEIVADVYYLLSEADEEDYDHDQNLLYQERRLKISSVLADSQLSSAAFDALLEQGSTAGLLIRARQIAGETHKNREYTESEQHRFLKAAQYLESNRETIVFDGRCLALLLRYWWASKVGKPMFFEERQTVAFRNQDWLELVKIVTDLLATSEGQGHSVYLYLLGLAHFHLNELVRASTVFSELERGPDFTLGRRRITRSYLASTPDGSPFMYHGTVNWADDDRNRGQIDVEELRFLIRFLPRDFRSGLQKGEAISSGFHIAFNFIGPLADPVRFYRFQYRKDA